jgi:hypothetical protein
VANPSSEPCSAWQPEFWVTFSPVSCNHGMVGQHWFIYVLRTDNRHTTPWGGKPNPLLVGVGQPHNGEVPSAWRGERRGEESV